MSFKDRKNAAFFKAVAYDLRGDRPSAHRIVSDLESNLLPGEMPAATALWISTAGADVALQDLEEAAPPQELAHGAVSLALARRALEAEQLDAAERYARQAAAGEPGWVDPLTFLAGILIHKRFGTVVRAGFSRPPVPDWPDFVEVRKLFTEAIQRIGAYALPDRVVPLRLNLGLAYAIVGDTSNAEREFSEALEAAPDDPEVLSRYAKYLQIIGRGREAVGAIRSWLDGHASVQVELLLAQVLYACGGTEHRREAIRILERKDKLTDADPQLRSDWLSALVETYLEVGDVASAKRVIDETPRDEFEDAVHELRLAEVERSEGRGEAALAAAHRSRAALPPRGDSFTRMRLALVYESLQQFETALTLWQDVAEPTAATAEALHLIHCARRCGATPVTARFCEQLRQNRVHGAMI